VQQVVPVEEVQRPLRHALECVGARLRTARPRLPR
jgi:hypothetical protein